jgi:hypothetical protein
VEVAETWRAPARLAYTTMTICCWGIALPRVRFISFITRVMEKPGVLSIAIVTDCLAILKTEGILSSFDFVHIITDTGTHYRCNQFLAATAYTWPDAFRLSFRLTYQLEHHGKGRIDRYFGVLSHRKKEAASAHMLSTIADLIFHYRALGDKRVLKTFDETFVDYMPKPKKNVVSHFLHPGCLPALQQQCHHWTMSITDNRRLSLTGSGLDKDVCTAILMKAHMLPTIAGVACRTSTPILATKAEDIAVAVLDEAIDMPTSASAMLGEIKDVGGWRCSYRTSTPEFPDEARLNRRLSWKRKGMDCVNDKIPTASRHTCALPPELQAERRAEKSNKQKAVAATLGGYRLAFEDG